MDCPRSQVRFLLGAAVVALCLLGCVLSEVDPLPSPSPDVALPTAAIAASTVLPTVEATASIGAADVVSPTSTVRLPSPTVDAEGQWSPDARRVQVDWADIVGQGPRFYGVEYAWIDQDRELYLERYRDLHLNTVRVQVSQEVFEPVNDNDDPNHSEIDFSLTVPVDVQLGKTMTYDAMFKALAAEFPAMHFQINVWLAARWNATEPQGYLGLGGALPPRDYAEHREFIRAMASWLVDGCGIPPGQLSFTFTNEANLRGFFVGDQADLLRLAHETRMALDQVSPLIQMGGLDEVHGTVWTDQFYAQHSTECCDMWTLHAYQRGLPALSEALLGGIDRLSQYGPVWVTEFADTANGSPDAQMDFSTRAAGLGFAEVLGRLWLSEADGIIHFRLSDTYADLLGGWAGHGLFADSRGTHAGGEAYKPFPSYWVFANMYRELGSDPLVRVSGPDEWVIVAARRDEEPRARLAIWVTNPTSETQIAVFELSHFPAGRFGIQVYNNLSSNTPVEAQIKRDEKAFETIVPQQSSYLFVVEVSQ